MGQRAFWVNYHGQTWDLRTIGIRASVVMEQRMKRTMILKFPLYRRLQALSVYHHRISAQLSSNQQYLSCTYIPTSTYSNLSPSSLRLCSLQPTALQPPRTLKDLLSKAAWREFSWLACHLLLTLTSR
jgi:hypothetical protein